MTIDEYDVVILGAGFGAIATIIRLRKYGYKIRIYEKGSQLGGIWYWNCYPGARVDSDAPIYQLFNKEVWEDYSFKERYPSWQELRHYFEYLDKKYDLKKDITFDTACTGARFDEEKHQWVVDLSDGSQARARWFIPCIGFAAKPFTPNYPGIENFKGGIYHTANWPQKGVDLKGKRVAVIGTGASGVQTIQETGHDAKQLTVYQRTPNLAIPMNQRQNDPEDVARRKREGHYDSAFDLCFKTFAGFNYDFLDKNTFDDSPEDRRKQYEWLLIKEGGFKFWLNNYKDLFFNEEANREAYNFWRDFVRSRLNDPKKMDILAPMEPPHPWGTKRPSLEQFYYEIFNLPHVDLIDLQNEPVEEVTETGIKTASGHREFDVIALATGFDSVTGSLSQLDIRSTKGETIQDHWKDGLRTQIGIALAGFPNMFFLYGPQAPTAFSNGPSCVQIQAIWLDKVFQAIQDKGYTRIEAKPEVEERWTKKTHEGWYSSLFPKAKSWYQGSNIPGKKEEPLNFAGGIPVYMQSLDDSIANNFQDWVVS